MGSGNRVWHGVVAVQGAGRPRPLACGAPQANSQPTLAHPGAPDAILRSTRRIILPLRVLGSPGAQWITSGTAKGPMLLSGGGEKGDACGMW